MGLDASLASTLQNHPTSGPAARPLAKRDGRLVLFGDVARESSAAEAVGVLYGVSRRSASRSRASPSAR